jgi:hypothetical protein
MLYSITILEFVICGQIARRKAFVGSIFTFTSAAKFENLYIAL